MKINIIITKYLLLAVLFSSSFAHAMKRLNEGADSEQASKKLKGAPPPPPLSGAKVMLQWTNARQGEGITIPKEHAALSMTLKNMLQDLEDSDIPIPLGSNELKISHKILESITKYLGVIWVNMSQDDDVIKAKLSNTLVLTPQEMRDVLEVAHFLDIRLLLEAISETWLKYCLNNKEAVLKNESIWISKDLGHLILSKLYEYGDIEAWLIDASCFKIKLNDNYKLGRFCISPNGQMLVTTDDSVGTITVWNLSEGEWRLIQTINEGTLPASALVFSPDNNKFATGDYTGTVRVWTLLDEKWHLQHSFQAEEKTYSLAFSPQAQILASAQIDSITLWDLDEGLCLAKLEDDVLEKARFIRSITYSPDGNSIAFQCESGLRLLNIENFSWQHLIGDNGSQNLEDQAICFSPHGKTLASISDDRTNIYDCKGETWFSFHILDGCKPALFIGDNSIIALNADQCGLKIYDFINQKWCEQPNLLKFHQGKHSSIYLSQNCMAFGVSYNPKNVINVYDVSLMQAVASVLNGSSVEGLLLIELIRTANNNKEVFDLTESKNFMKIFNTLPEQLRNYLINNSLVIVA